jgi:hypothetical protein
MRDIMGDVDVNNTKVLADGPVNVTSDAVGLLPDQSLSMLFKEDGSYHPCVVRLQRVVQRVWLPM